MATCTAGGTQKIPKYGSTQYGKVQRNIIIIITVSLLNFKSAEWLRHMSC